MKNKYCSYSSLRNEADVEQNFVRRLLQDLGYDDSEIRPQSTLESLTVGGMRGHKQAKYRPDFALIVDGKTRCLVEAKEPAADLDEHVWQVRAYAVFLNGESNQDRTVLHYVLTNGTETRIYHIDRNDPLFVVPFTSFTEGTAKFDELRGLLSRANIVPRRLKQGDQLRMHRPSISEVNAAFSWCHQHIYKKDNISQSDAFSEFVKLISLKLMSDRKIRDTYPESLEDYEFDVPNDAVQFSAQWIKKNEQVTPSPISEILFRRFMDEMEQDIAKNTRKRIFEQGAMINLRPETIAGVVGRLENLYLFGIDADLNGRLFETFLNATMRGKDLGQFFTPRSVIKLGVRLANLQVDVPSEDGGRHTDTVLDACSGTGGFLIDVLADMWNQVEQRTDLAEDRKLEIKDRIANEAIVGVDIANAPILARIARLNMYLHGDGGTKVFHLNVLDPHLHETSYDSAEIIKEKSELRAIFRDNSFDVVLTNPPFAKALDRSSPDEERILNSYEIGRGSGNSRGSIRSVLLFLERYAKLLKPGGRMITVIDDGILSGNDFAWFRNKLREWFLIRAVVSLPGDAFQRSNARVKTSYLIVEKRRDSQQENPPVFMYPCQHVGNDDPKRQRPRAGDSELRRLANQEIVDASAAFDEFLSGRGDSKFIVPASRIEDRLDVKNCLMEAGRQQPKWDSQGIETHPLQDMLELRTYSEDEYVTKESTEPVRIMVVRYSGVAEVNDEINPGDSSYSRLYRVYENDIVISNIAASHGSIALVTEELAGCVVSSEYTVLKAKPDFDPVALQMILRSPEMRADILLSSSGANRTRMRWDFIKDLKMPYPDSEVVETIRESVERAHEARKVAEQLVRDSQQGIQDQLYLDTAEAEMVLAAFKPPK